MVAAEAQDTEALAWVASEGDEALARLDKVVACHCPQWSRTRVQRWIQEGRVLVDDELAHARSRVRRGVEITVFPAPREALRAAPEALAIEVVHEDDDLLVVNKGAGMVTHPAPGHPSGTLVNALVFYFGRLPGDSLRPGIVHRLDKDTSGLLVVAKTPRAHGGLVALFQAHDLDREYVALCHGPMRRGEQTFDAVIGRHPRDRKRFSSKVERGKRAVTHVSPGAQGAMVSEVTCRLETGRTHQIRVHLSDAGFPLVGDGLYGNRARDVRAFGGASVLGRQALHARRLGFVHPVSGDRIDIIKEPPEDYGRAREILVRSA